uniref:Putative miniature n=1 Tax=Corethrella appendiculata TaxID=1370023 RepID=U5EDC4_9DIPT
MWSYRKGPTHHPLGWDFRIIFLVLINFMFSLVAPANELWPVERPDGMPNIVSLEVMCGKDHMDVHLSFSQPFEGIVSSKGQHSDPRCVYVPPSTGKTFFSFRISYSRCGTKPDLHGQFYENTVVVQYDKDLLEVWDEAKRLRCEWFNDYEKTASKPPMVIADLDVIQLDFRGDNVDCWMEIQQGKGPWAPAVSGIVPLGSTMTLVVAINDYRGEFDMRVKSCVASDGAGHLIKLSDEFGCVLRPKMISRFLKARAPDDKASVITYAFFHAFKFPDALSVHIKCKVEICRHGCLDHCQHTVAPGQHDPLERKDTLLNEKQNNPNNNIKNNVHESEESNENQNAVGQDTFYDDIIHTDSDINNLKKSLNIMQKKKDNNMHPHHQQHQYPPSRHSDAIDNIESLFLKNEQQIIPEKLKTQKQFPPPPPPQFPQQQTLHHHQHLSLNEDERFPHGPRQLEAENRIGLPAVAGPRSLKFDDDTDNDPQAYAHKKRQKRSIKITDRKVRSADVGVSGIYEVISEADLAFSPDIKQEAVTVFQGKITEEVVYGICMPIPGFSVLFILVISATIVSALIAGSLLYRYQLQKEVLAQQQQNPHAQTSAVNNGTLATWMTLRLFNKARHNSNCSRNLEVNTTAQ